MSQTPRGADRGDEPDVVATSREPARTGRLSVRDGDRRRTRAPATRARAAGHGPHDVWMPWIDGMAILTRAVDLDRDVVPDHLTHFPQHRAGNVAPAATPAGLGG